MKKFGFFLFAVLGLIACGDDNNDPTPEQHVTCSISAPAEGAMVNIAEKMTKLYQKLPQCLLAMIIHLKLTKPKEH